MITTQLRAQSHKRNRKAWDHCPSSLGVKFGKHDQDPEGIVKRDLSYISQIFLPKLMGNDPKPCGFIYMIGAFTSMQFPQIALFPYF